MQRWVQEPVHLEGTYHHPSCRFQGAESEHAQDVWPRLKIGIQTLSNHWLDKVKLRLTVDLFKIFSEMSHVFLLDVRIRLAEISTFWPGAVAESMSVGVQLLNSIRIYQTLRQQFLHCSKDADPP